MIIEWNKGRLVQKDERVKKYIFRVKIGKYNKINFLILNKQILNIITC